MAQTGCMALLSILDSYGCMALLNGCMALLSILDSCLYGKNSKEPYTTAVYVSDSHLSDSQKRNKYSKEPYTNKNTQKSHIQTFFI